MEVCPSCGSYQPHDGECPALQAGAVAQAYVDPRQIVSGHMLQGRYEILHVLGQGGMGTVFMSRDMRLKGRNCVVKKLRDDFYREEDRQKAQSFFEREMAVLSDLQHRNIVQILDYFREGGDYYLVMEYVQGNNLHYMLHEERGGEPFPENAVIDWAIQICDVLSYLHSQNPAVIYRDLKPSNVMIDLKGEVKLVDFGIARPWEETGEHTHVVSAGYSPPEQYWGAADPRSDVYSLGATMHFLLTGRDPEALHACHPKSINADVSDFTDHIVQKATAQEVNERFQTVEEFTEALLHKDYVAAPENPRSRVGEVVTGVVLLVVAIFIFLVENMQNGDSTAHKAAAMHNLRGEADPSIGDAREEPVAAGNMNEQKPKPAGGPNQQDLAVQVMDEPDLTDPAGAAAAQETQKPSFGLRFPSFLQQKHR